MTSSSEIINGRYGELTLDGKKYQYDKAAMPNTWKLWNHETSDWVAAVNPLGDIADSGAAEPVLGHLSKSGKNVLSCNYEDWTEVTGIRQVMDTVEMNDDICVMYSKRNAAGPCRSSYAVMTTPGVYEVISLFNIEDAMTDPISGMRGAFIQDVKWSGAKWVMLFLYNEKLYIIWSDDAKNWRWPDNNPTGLHLDTSYYQSDGLAHMYKGNSDDEFMLIYRVTNYTTLRTVHTTTAFDTADITATETIGGAGLPISSSDRVATVIKIGTRWVIFYQYVYNTNSIFNTYPKITINNGTNWTNGAKLPSQSTPAYFVNYMLVGNRLVVQFSLSGYSSQGKMQYYTDDFSVTWTKIYPGQRLTTSLKFPISYGYETGNYETGQETGNNAIEEIDGVFTE